MHTRARGRVRNYGIACIGRLEVTAVLSGRFPPGAAVANGAFLSKIFGVDLRKSMISCCLGGLRYSFHPAKILDLKNLQARYSGIKESAGTFVDGNTVAEIARALRFPVTHELPRSQQSRR
jgi:hypothetical protein